MPVTFDFANTGAGFSVFATGPNTVSNTADGVTFTVSSNPLGGLEQILFGNSDLLSVPLFLADNGTNDIFTLRFESTVNTANDTLSGTATNPVAISWNAAGAGTYQIQFLTTGGGTTGTTTVNVGITGMASIVHATINGIRFTSSGVGGDAISLTNLSANALQCYLAGTRIATPGGEVAVETLQPGDLVLTADGGETTVQWLGRQEIAPRFEHPAKVNPVCINAGALADGVPARDLYVSPDHAVEIDGVLINAMALVNGRSIYQVRDMPLDGFTYYHVETDAHELLLAEGCPAESYLDIPDREAFVNGDERADAPPIREMDRLRISSRRLLPQAIAARLAARVPRRAA